MQGECKEKESKPGIQAEKDSLQEERKKLALEKNQCPPFTANPSYTLKLGNCVPVGGVLSLSLACSWGLVGSS